MLFFRPLWQALRPYGRWAYYGMFPHRRPDYFNAAWQYPDIGHDQLRDILARPAGSGSRVFLFFPLADWHARMQRSQHLASALADLGHTCIYVSPHLGLEYREPFMLSPQPKMKGLRAGVFELHIHLPAEHPIESRLLTAGETERVISALIRLARQTGGFGNRHVVQVTSLPSWTGVVRGLRDRLGYPVIFDCHDYLPGFERIPPSVAEAESALLEVSDLVVFSSAYLRDQIVARNQAIGARNEVIRNGCRPQDFALRRPADSVRDGVKQVGYAGSLDHWFDIEAAVAAAQAHPRVRFTFAGRIEDDRVRRLGREPNVRLIGEIPYSAVPRFLEQWDVALIPFLASPLTLATDPVKIYEYFSAGLPVVSRHLPELERFGDLTYLARTPSEFAELVSRALAEHDPDKAERRRATAVAEAWSQRAQAFLDATDGITPALPTPALPR